MHPMLPSFEFDQKKAPLLLQTQKYSRLKSAIFRCVCVCVNSASTGLGLCHNRVSTHRPVLPAPLGAAVNKD